MPPQPCLVTPVFMTFRCMKLEMNKQEKSLGLKKQWYKISRKGDYSGLDTWNGLRGKEREAEGYRGRPGWTMSGPEREKY